eukprot:CAMPEP_0113963760 /NCGR_PEP_ID=MMETSP0011_2-20120614/6717_1 /TAXON_ID=101924 /ORGANISM="Rhodosorus marinus" /LENGTH=216 /DNA_ID=CAMNT_0000975895 /DNA_START=143 /DNA_END=793 /DNA_ORIENTATION=- /assembly_acc=CAM_ASM_000156
MTAQAHLRRRHKSETCVSGESIADAHGWTSLIDPVRTNAPVTPALRTPRGDFARPATLVWDVHPELLERPAACFISCHAHKSGPEASRHTVYRLVIVLVALSAVLRLGYPGPCAIDILPVLALVEGIDPHLQIEPLVDAVADALIPIAAWVFVLVLSSTLEDQLQVLNVIATVGIDELFPELQSDLLRNYALPALGTFANHADHYGPGFVAGYASF